MDGGSFFPVSSRLDRGPWITPWIPTAVMPPTQVDPFWMPGVIAMPTEPLRISDMSSDDEAEPEIGPPIASKKKGKNNVAAAAGRVKLVRGGASSRAPHAPDAPGHGIAAPAAVETSGEPAKSSSPLRKPPGLRAEPAPSKRRRSLSDNVSEAPAASLPMLQKRNLGRKGTADLSGNTVHARMCRKGFLSAYCRFPYCNVRHMSATLYLRIAHHSMRDILSRKGERMCVGARIVELCGQMVHGSIFEAKPDFDAHLQGSGDST